MRYAPPHSRPSAEISGYSRLLSARDKRTLKLHFILNNKRVLLVANGLGEFGRNSMMSSLVLDDEALVTLHTLQHGGLFYRPGADVGPFFVSLVLVALLLLRMGRLPPRLPVIRELLEERGFNRGGLVPGDALARDAQTLPAERRTVNVGFSIAEEVADSAADDTELAASAASLFTSSTASAAYTAEAPSTAEASAAKRIVTSDYTH